MISKDWIEEVSESVNGPIVNDSTLSEREEVSEGNEDKLDTLS